MNSQAKLWRRPRNKIKKQREKKTNSHSYGPKIRIRTTRDERRNVLTCAVEFSEAKIKRISRLLHVADSTNEQRKKNKFSKHTEIENYRQMNK